MKKCSSCIGWSFEENDKACKFCRQNNYCFYESIIKRVGKK